jgi:hypothetical protein
MKVKQIIGNNAGQVHRWVVDQAAGVDLVVVDDVGNRYMVDVTLTRTGTLWVTAKRDDGSLIYNDVVTELPLFVRNLDNDVANDRARGTLAP